MTEATASLETKTQAVTELEGQIAALQASLDGALADAENKGSAVEELEKGKAEVESELSTLKAALEEARADKDGDSAVLKTVQEEVCLTPFSYMRSKHPHIACCCQVCESYSDGVGSESSGSD